MGEKKINHPNSTFRYRVQLKTHTVKPVFYSLNCSVVFLSIISITSEFEVIELNFQVTVYTQGGALPPDLSD